MHSGDDTAIEGRSWPNFWANLAPFSPRRGGRDGANEAGAGVAQIGLEIDFLMNRLSPRVSVTAKSSSQYHRRGGGGHLGQVERGDLAAALRVERHDGDHDLAGERRRVARRVQEALRALDDVELCAALPSAAKLQPL